MSKALFRHKSCAHHAALTNVEFASIRATNAYRRGRRLQNLARNGFKELALPVTGNASNTNNFTGFNAERNVFQCSRKRTARSLRQVFDFKSGAACVSKAAIGLRATTLMSFPTIMRASDAAVSCLGSQCATTLP